MKLRTIKTIAFLIIVLLFVSIASAKLCIDPPQVISKLLDLNSQAKAGKITQRDFISQFKDFFLSKYYTKRNVWRTEKNCAGCVTEKCDGLDNNCDDEIDENPWTLCSKGNVCINGDCQKITACSNIEEKDACLMYEGKCRWSTWSNIFGDGCKDAKCLDEDICDDGLDNDCNGEVDDGCKVYVDVSCEEADVDGDGEVDDGDARAIDALSDCSITNPCMRRWYNADVNRDNVVDDGDIAVIEKLTYMDEKGYSIIYDANRDGVINSHDELIIEVFRSCSKENPCPNINSIHADINKDGSVDNDDEYMVSQMQGKKCNPRAPDVPVESLYSCGSDTLLGDIDGDGKVSSTDLNIIGKIEAGALEKPTNICCVDLNSDGKVDILDLQAVSRTSLGVGDLVGKRCSGITPQPITYNCNSNSLMGDIDNDGQVNSRDGLIVERIKNGMYKVPSNKCCVDFDKDGDVDMADLQDLSRTAIGEGNYVGRKCS